MSVIITSCLRNFLSHFNFFLFILSFFFFCPTAFNQRSDFPTPTHTHAQGTALPSHIHQVVREATLFYFLILVPPPPPPPQLSTHKKKTKSTTFNNKLQAILHVFTHTCVFPFEFLRENGPHCSL